MAHRQKNGGTLQEIWPSVTFSDLPWRLICDVFTHRHRYGVGPFGLRPGPESMTKLLISSQIRALAHLGSIRGIRSMTNLWFRHRFRHRCVCWTIWALSRATFYDESVVSSQSENLFPCQARPPSKHSLPVIGLFPLNGPPYCFSPQQPLFFFLIFTFY
jgi:hypothetical protein